MTTTEYLLYKQILKVVSGSAYVCVCVLFLYATMEICFSSLDITYREEGINAEKHTKQ